MFLLFVHSLIHRMMLAFYISKTIKKFKAHKWLISPSYLKVLNSNVGWSFHQFSSLSPVWLFATSWTAACQASLSINSLSLLRVSMETPMEGTDRFWLSHVWATLKDKQEDFPVMEDNIQVDEEAFGCMLDCRLGEAGVLCRPSYCEDWCSVAQSCPTLCDPVGCSTPGLPVHH